MVRRICFAPLLVATFLLGFSATADDSAATSGVKQAAEETVAEPTQDWETRHDAATLEYNARVSEFLNGRAPANAVIQSNTRLLHAALMIGIPNAAVDYDRRASHVESIAKTNLGLGTGTRQELEQARNASLAALLKNYLDRNTD